MRTFSLNMKLAATDVYVINIEYQTVNMKGIEYDGLKLYFLFEYETICYKCISREQRIIK